MLLDRRSRQASIRPHAGFVEHPGRWALGSVAVGVALGALFPKATTVVLFPFSTFGIST